MNKKLSIIILGFLLVFSSISYAKNDGDTTYTVSGNTIIGKNNDKGNISDQYTISNYLDKKNSYDLKDFNLNDGQLKKVLSSHSGKTDLVIESFQVKKGALIKTLSENVFITADSLSRDTGKFTHKGDYMFMNGKVNLKHIENSKVKDTKKISTLEEYKMIVSSSLDTRYWNDISYEKDGILSLEEVGYYLISVKDEKLDTKELLIIEVTDKEITNNKTIEFKDVKKDSWYYDEVVSAVREGIIIGRDDNTFDPWGKLTLAEAITLSAKLRSKSDGDVFIEGGTRWYDEAVAYAMDKNIIKVGDFIDYNKKASREEMAYIFSRTLREDKYTIDDEIVLPTDINLEDRYYQNIVLLYKANILKGRDDGMFDAKSDITRAEAATIINRLVK